MKIGLYHELSGSELGGTEYTIAVLAEALRHGHDVEIVNHAPSVTLARLEGFFGIDLRGVRVRAVPPEAAQQPALSATYDLFVAFMHGRPPVCHAVRGMLVVLFPFFIPPDSWVGWSRPCPVSRFPWPGQWRAREEWRRCMASYEWKAAISRYSAEYAKAWWEIDCAVWHPPVDTSFRVRSKRNLILSVGRFTTAWHTKKQLEMLTAFRALDAGILTAWRYVSAGGLSETAEDRAFFERVRTQTQRFRVIAAPNVERQRLKALYERSKVFWLSTGYGEDDRRRPDQAEHFGIVTVEAMAAGCVPVLIDKGAQREIVEHGVHGFLWKSIEELKAYTVQLARDAALLARMSAAARQRADEFSRDRFLARFDALVGDGLRHDARRS